MSYKAPIEDLRFILSHVVGFDRVQASARFSEASDATVDAILAGVGSLAEEVLAPLNRGADLQGARLVGGVVETSPGFAEAYRALAEGGWVALAAGAEHGGMGLPLTLASCVNDLLGGACLSLQLNLLLTQGQIEALEHHASPEIGKIFLPKLISGQWTGTMNLTEAQAGSDVGALRSTALPLGGGRYAVTGQKIFISWADADFAENICHLVLARLPDAPAGTRGISLFLVPKYLPDASGEAGEANRLKVVSLEHKMGLHGSPTAVMAFEGATGWLIGAPHRGLAAMFTMMNNARLGVGLQGVSGAEGAYQQALGYALARVQGPTASAETGAIIDHADVRRMLVSMASEIFAARAICLATAVALDRARAEPEGNWAARASFLTPIAKAYGTDTGISVAQAGIQVHGGMGFIEEAGASQYLRDVRVTAIYEGTNGIQAADLVGRKLADGGAEALALIAEIAAHAGAASSGVAARVAQAALRLQAATEAMVALPAQDRLAGSVAYLRAFALVLGGHFHLKAVVAAGADSPRARLAQAFVTRHLGHLDAALAEALNGAADIYAISPQELAR